MILELHGPVVADQEGVAAGHVNLRKLELDLPSNLHALSVGLILYGARS
jgi:hypothetical protein